MISTAVDSDRAPTAADIENWIVEKLACTYGIAPQTIDRSEPMQNYGLDSLGAFTIAGELVDWLRGDLPVHLLWEYRTVESLARYLAGDARDKQSFSPLVTLQPLGEKPPLFLVPPGGASVHTYCTLVQYLGQEHPVYGFEHCGLQDIDEAHTTIEEMATCYLQQMKAVQPVGPYYLGGRCVGAIVALEMAQQLLARGELVALLAAIDYAPYDDSIHRRCFRVLRQLPHRCRDEVRKWMASTSQANDSEEELPSNPLDARSKRLALMHAEASKKYRGRAYAGRVTLMQANEHSWRIARRQRSIWKKVASGGVEVCPVPGDHWSLGREPHVQVLAEELRRILNSGSRHDESLTRAA